MSQITKILDSKPVAIFFAIWTGLYLAQVWKGQAGARSDLWWIVGATLLGLVLV